MVALTAHACFGKSSCAGDIAFCADRIIFFTNISLKSELVELLIVELLLYRQQG